MSTSHLLSMTQLRTVLFDHLYVLYAPIICAFSFFFETDYEQLMMLLLSSVTTHEKDEWFKIAMHTHISSRSKLYIHLET